MLKKSILLALIAMIVAGCSIEKRHHQKGVHIQWKHQKLSINKINIEADEPENISTLEVENADNLELKSKQNTNMHLSNMVTSQEENQEEFASKTASSTHEKRYPKKGKVKTEQVKIYRDLTKVKASTEISKSKKSNWMLFGGAGILALLSFVGIKLFRKKTNRITKWASNNKVKTRFLVGAIQTTLAGLALYEGFNLGKMNYDFSSSSFFVSSGLLALFFGTTALSKKGGLILEKRLMRRRMSFIGVALSGMMALAVVGNKTSQSPNSFMYDTLEQIDQSLIDSPNDMDSETSTEELSKREKTATIIFGGAVALLILLGILACAGMAGVFFGFILITDGLIGVLLLTGGVLFFVLAVQGIKSVLDRVIAENT